MGGACTEHAQEHKVVLRNMHGEYCNSVVPGFREPWVSRLPCDDGNCKPGRARHLAVFYVRLHGGIVLCSTSSTPSEKLKVTVVRHFSVLSHTCLLSPQMIGCSVAGQQALAGGAMAH